MNEEEKQAIEYLKHSIFEYEEIDTSVMEYIDKNHKIIYKLILKQQKEIEELKIIEKLFHYRIEEIEPEIFIDKDKIRKLIKGKAKTDTYNFKTISVKDIEELLGETND